MLRLVLAVLDGGSGLGLVCIYNTHPSHQQSTDTAARAQNGPPCRNAESTCLQSDWRGARGSGRLPCATYMIGWQATPAVGASASAHALLLRARSYMYVLYMWRCCCCCVNMNTKRPLATRSKTRSDRSRPLCARMHACSIARYINQSIARSQWALLAAVLVAAAISIATGSCPWS